MSEDLDHDRFLNKNKMLAQAYEMANTQDKIRGKYGDNLPTERAMSCFNCKKKTRCQEFRSKSTGGAAGAVSIDKNTSFLCDKYDPIPVNTKDKAMSGNQIKSILKAAKFGRL